jgi:hypothetical protein
MLQMLTAMEVRLQEHLAQVTGWVAGWLGRLV